MYVSEQDITISETCSALICVMDDSRKPIIRRASEFRRFDDKLSNSPSHGWRRSSLASLVFVPSNGSPLHVVDSARRRLSNVSDAVSRKISHTIGWRPSTTPVDTIIRQGSAMCGQYIKNRLKRSGIFQRKLGLKRMKSAIMSTDGSAISEVYPVLVVLGTELEKIEPTLFVKVPRQVGCRSLSTEQNVAEVITDVSREMFRSGEMTWSKIIALYAVAGGVAVDCVHQGKPEFIPVIQRAMTDVLGQYLAIWIQANGGWCSLSARCRPIQKNFLRLDLTAVIVVAILMISVLLLLLKILF